MKRLGLHRVDGRSYWFAGYFSPFDRDRMIRYAGQARADRFQETFGGAVPFAEARLVRVYDPDPVAARQCAETFGLDVADNPVSFADGLDGIIVPFPAGGSARDYGAVAAYVEQGIPLYLDRIILEQSDRLAGLMAVAERQEAPLHIASFIRYAVEVPGPVTSVLATVTGDPVGYGADLIGTVDALMQGRMTAVVNRGNADGDVLDLDYEGGRHAVLQLWRRPKTPMQVTVTGGQGTSRLTLDGSQNHRAAFRQFQAFLGSLETREPPVPYEEILRESKVLQFAERRVYGQRMDV